MQTEVITPETLESLCEAGKIVEHHTAWARGYVSRRTTGVVEEYCGRYGEGYILHSPSWESTRYHRITYYLIATGEPMPVYTTRPWERR